MGNAEDLYPSEQIKQVLEQPRNRIDHTINELCYRLQGLWLFHSLCQRSIRSWSVTLKEMMSELDRSNPPGGTNDIRIASLRHDFTLALYEVHDDFPRLHANLVLRLWGIYETYVIDLLANIISLSVFDWTGKPKLCRKRELVRAVGFDLDHSDYRKIIKDARSELEARPRGEGAGWTIENLLKEVGFPDKPMVADETRDTMARLYKTRNTIVHSVGQDYEGFSCERRAAIERGEIEEDFCTDLSPAFSEMVTSQQVRAYWHHVVEYAQNIRLRSLRSFRLEATPYEYACSIQMLPAQGANETKPPT